MIDLRHLSPHHQAPWGTAPFHSWDAPDGAILASFYRTATGILLRFPDLADFEVSADGCSVTCVPALGVSKATTDHLYLNQVLPLALSKLGKPVFHASAVEVAGGAIAFLAASGRGKSTLAAGFAVNGHRFLTDDSLVLEHAEGHHVVHPSHPSLRLWEDSEERLVRGEARLAPALDYTSKVRLLAGPLFSHCDQPRRLLAAYFLGDGSVEEINVRLLTEAETLIEWAKHSFLLDVEDKAQIAIHFHQIALLANGLKCYHLDYPRCYDELARVIDAVAAHAANLSSPS